MGAPFAVEVLHLAETHVRIDDQLRRVDLLLGDDLPRDPGGLVSGRGSFAQETWVGWC